MGVDATPSFTITDKPSREEALKYALEWVAQDPQNREYHPMLATSSMKPYFDENSFSLGQKCSGADVKKGDLVIFDRADGVKNVIHKVAALSDNAFIPDGTNNKRYDGWQPKSGITAKAQIVRWKQAAPGPTNK